jgi:hypothetical protein
MSDRFPVRVVCLTVACATAVLAVVLPQAVAALLPLPFAVRVAVAMAIAGPLGFAMGMPFPRGLRSLGAGLPAPPFYWGLNGVLSVIGSVGTMMIAVMLGFRAAMLAGAAAYLLAALASSWITRNAPEA